MLRRGHDVGGLHHPDAYGTYHLIDDITVNGKSFSSAADNSNGNNNLAGPLATLDPTLLPPIIPLPQLR